MPEESTDFITKDSQPRGESKIFDVSIRAYIALVCIITYSVLSIIGKMPVDTVKDITILILTFYFTTNAVHKETK